MWQYVANHCKPFGFFTAYRVTLRIVYSSVYHIDRYQMYIVLYYPKNTERRVNCGKVCGILHVYPFGCCYNEKKYGFRLQ